MSIEENNDVHLRIAERIVRIEWDSFLGKKRIETKG